MDGLLLSLQLVLLLGLKRDTRDVQDVTQHVQLNQELHQRNRIAMDHTEQLNQQLVHQAVQEHLHVLTVQVQRAIQLVL